MRNLAEALLPQPTSFSKKKAYEVHEVLGTGTFGEVVVGVAFLYCYTGI
jgi:calcium/calmodulin-dependent protein kinase I